MNLTAGSVRRFDATLSLQRTPITGGSLTRVLLTYPLMTWKVTAMIYRQAFRLLRKGARIHTHPKKRNSLDSGDR
jgi:DUF1365 family protein